MNPSAVSDRVPDAIPVFDYFDADHQGAGRYRFLGELREAEVPLAVDQFGRINLLRHDDVRGAFVDNDRYRSVEAAVAEAMAGGEGPLVDWQRNTLINMNPPRHTRLRNAVRPLNARLARRLEPTIRAQCHRLIDAFPDNGEVDFSTEFAFKLPVAVIMALLHLPAEDEDRIAQWSPKTLPVGPYSVPEANWANREFRSYVEALVDDRRRHPVDEDVVTDLIALQDRGELSHDELWGTIQTLVLAGHETTSGALETGLHALLERPERWQRIRADPALIANAAEEILRWDAPVDVMPRILAEDTVLQGVPLAAGSMINLNIASANHDPRVFTDPDAFDPARPNANRHLTFGVGIHRCVGAPLAQVELPIALEVLCERLSALEVVEVPRYAFGFFRHFTALRVAVRKQ
ncbi:cytochrome P450 [Mycolicibacterium sp.]|uniref:cytochrome P450 n=1 Tax=Mycolicibacterium sp. TaxID=2320850 RepID=UPI003D0EA42E